MSGISLGFAFSAGLIASLNPCAFAMLPAYAAYYLGLDGEGRGAGSAGLRTLRALLVAGSMTAGFLAVFVGIGLLVSLAGSGLLRYQDLVGVAVGLALVSLGSWLAAGRTLGVVLPNPVRDRRRRDLASAAVYGVGFGLASLACTLPIFLIVVGSAFVEGSLAGALALFIAYSLGMGAVVVAVTLGAALFRGAVARLLRRALPLVQRASGVLLVLAGTYLTVRQLDQARLGALATLQPHAAEVGAGLAASAALAAGVLAALGGRESGDARRAEDVLPPALAQSGLTGVRRR